MKANSQRNLLSIALGPGESIRTSEPNKHTKHKTHQDKNPDKGNAKSGKRKMNEEY
jgi:hypothetical protein